jgi:hypothetical protein
MLKLATVDDHQAPLEQEPPAANVGHADDGPPNAGEKAVKTNDRSDARKTPHGLLEGKLLLGLVGDFDCEADDHEPGADCGPDHGHAELREGPTVPLGPRKLLDKRAQPGEVVVGDKLAKFFEHGEQFSRRPRGRASRKWVPRRSLGTRVEWP